jgi:uncharacterized membrane protein
MTFWELIGVVATSAGLFASILGAFLAYATRKNGEATRGLIQGTEEATRELIRSSAESTRELTRSMEERMTRHFTEVLERMDLRADERHREVIEAIRTLRAA